MKTKNKLLTKFLIENKLKPIYIYENLHQEDTKKVIRKETSNLSGVYLIFNKITGDYYVGSASTNRFYARFSNHLLYFRGSKIVKLAVKKYKLNNFAFLILELFPEIINRENNKKLLDIEDFYLKLLLPNYNILTEAGSSFGYKHTELSRVKMKNRFSSRDLKFNQSSIEKSIKKENFNYSSLLNTNKSIKSIILYNLDNTVFGEYSNIIEAAKDVNCDPRTINRTLKTEKKILKRRFIVKYKN